MSFAPSSLGPDPCYRPPRAAFLEHPRSVEALRFEVVVTHLKHPSSRA